MRERMKALCTLSRIPDPFGNKMADILFYSMDIPFNRQTDKRRNFSLFIHSYFLVPISTRSKNRFFLPRNKTRSSLFLLLKLLFRSARIDTGSRLRVAPDRNHNLLSWKSWHVESISTVCRVSLIYIEQRTAVFPSRFHSFIITARVTMQAWFEAQDCFSCSDPFHSRLECCCWAFLLLFSHIIRQLLTFLCSKV